MAQMQYRGNLSAKVFPFLSSQFGRTSISPGADQHGAFGDTNGGDNNIPQAYYIHNVVPTSQGYKSVGYKDILAPIGVVFDRVITIRDPDMTRGWLGVTENGRLYMYEAGDTTWTDVSAQVLGWYGGDVSVAFADGYTYLCLSKFNLYKLSVANKTLTAVVPVGLVASGIVAITASANYMIVTDGVKIYWSSTLTPEDFTPSLITGAGSGTPSDVSGLIVALVPLSNGFAVYTSVNVVIAIYSQNPRFPWIFKGANNSKGVDNIQHITYSGDDNSNYAWTSAGLQQVTSTGATTIMAEVTDFLAGEEFEDFDSVTNTLSSKYLDFPFKVKLAFIGARFLIVSYGVNSLTHALVYDTALKRWGKLRIAHVSAFEVALNTEGGITRSTSATAKKTIGFVTATGAVSICDFENNADAKDSVIVLGKFQVMRSRTTTLDMVAVESVGKEDNFNVLVSTTLDGKTQLTPLALNARTISERFREYPARVTGVNHSLIFKGKFNLNSFELSMHFNGRR